MQQSQPNTQQYILLLLVIICVITTAQHRTDNETIFASEHLTMHPSAHMLIIFTCQSSMEIFDIGEILPLDIDTVTGCPKSHLVKFKTLAI